MKWSFLLKDEEEENPWRVVKKKKKMMMMVPMELTFDCTTQQVKMNMGGSSTITMRILMILIQYKEMMMETE
jgi:hypothetical protein